MTAGVDDCHALSRVSHLLPAGKRDSQRKSFILKKILAPPARKRSMAQPLTAGQSDVRIAVHHAEFKERAAIMEYDAQLSHSEAEAHAKIKGVTLHTLCQSFRQHAGLLRAHHRGNAGSLARHNDHSRYFVNETLSVAADRVAGANARAMTGEKPAAVVKFRDRQAL